MTKVRGRETSDLDTGEAGEGRSDGPMDVAIEMTTTVTPIAAEPTGATLFDPMERNENGKRRRRREAPAKAFAPGDWRSRIELAAQQQAGEIAQLHRTISKMPNMVDAQTPLQEAQWRGMKTWLEKREETWDAYHQDNIPWGRGITDMVTKAVTATEGGQRQREERKADTDGAGLEASIHADVTYIRRPEKPAERQQSQPGRQLKPNSTPKPNPAPPPTPRTTSTPIAVMTPVLSPARRWETFPPRNQQKPASPAPPPTTGSSLAGTRIILGSDKKVPLPNQMDQEITAAISRALFHHQAPAHIRIRNA